MLPDVNLDAQTTGDLGNLNSAWGYVIGAAADQLGKIAKKHSGISQAWYEPWGAKNVAKTIPIRTSKGININVSARGLAKTGSVLKGLGTTAGIGGLLLTGYQVLDGQISSTEAMVDATFGVIGFMGPIGAGISIGYFGGKAAYEYTTGESLFAKPVK